MFSVKGEDYLLELYITFNFKIFIYIIWLRLNNIFLYNGIFLIFIINF
jgi:hypothetical protein